MEVCATLTERTTSVLVLLRTEVSLLPNTSRNASCSGAVRSKHSCAVGLGYVEARLHVSVSVKVCHCVNGNRPFDG